MELSEIGIKLRAKNTTELIHMGIKKDSLFAELSLAPLSLNNSTQSLTVAVGVEVVELSLLVVVLSVNHNSQT
jgi:hypothetical protein